MTKDLLDCDSDEISALYQRLRGIASHAGVIWVTPGEFKPQSRHGVLMKCSVRSDVDFSHHCTKPVDFNDLTLVKARESK